MPSGGGSSSVLLGPRVSRDFECFCVVLVIESKLSLLATQQANKFKRRGVEARNMTLLGKLADGEDGRLMSQNKPSYWSLDASFFYRTKMGRGEGLRLKMLLILQISSRMASLQERIY